MKINVNEYVDIDVDLDINTLCENLHQYSNHELEILQKELLELISDTPINDKARGINDTQILITLNNGDVTMDNVEKINKFCENIWDA